MTSEGGDDVVPKRIRWLKRCLIRVPKWVCIYRPGSVIQTFWHFWVCKRSELVPKGLQNRYFSLINDTNIRIDWWVIKVVAIVGLHFHTTVLLIIQHGMSFRVIKRKHVQFEPLYILVF